MTIGVTDYAQEKLTDISYVEDFPDEGDELDAGDAICVLNTYKSSEEVYTPVAGTVLEVNGELDDEPELINSSPYEDGWIIKLKVADMDIGSFLTPEKYRELLAGEEE